MAVTISIEFSGAEFLTLQNAMAVTDAGMGETASDFTANVVKAKVVTFLSSKVGQYDRQRQTIAQSSFSPS